MVVTVVKLQVNLETHGMKAERETKQTRVNPRLWGFFFFLTNRRRVNLLRKIKSCFRWRVKRFACFFLSVLNCSNFLYTKINVYLVPLWRMDINVTFEQLWMCSYCLKRSENFILFCFLTRQNNGRMVRNINSNSEHLELITWPIARLWSTCLKENEWIVLWNRPRLLSFTVSFLCQPEF
jgi:hypothetical protein